MKSETLAEVQVAIDDLKLLIEEYDIGLSDDPEKDGPTLRINHAVQILIEHVPSVVSQVFELQRELLALKAFIEGYRAEVVAAARDGRS